MVVKSHNEFKIPSRIRNGIQLAAKIAQKREKGSTRYYHCAILTKKNRCVSVGWNSLKTHPKSKNKFSTLHAEVHCLIGIHEKELVNSQLFVVRVGGLGRKNLLLSKPCSFCKTFILESGLKRVYYSVSNNVIARWDVKNDVYTTMQLKENFII